MLELSKVQQSLFNGTETVLNSTPGSYLNVKRHKFVTSKFLTDFSLQERKQTKKAKLADSTVDLRLST